MRKEKIVLVTVSDDRSGRKDGKYSETQDRVLDLFRNNSTFGVTDFSFWKWEDIKNSEFYKKNNRMLDQIDPAMNGRCYKPFVILESLRSAEDGDFIIYNDVSPELWSKWEHNKIIDSSIGTRLSLGIFSQFSLNYIVHGLSLAAFQQKLAICN